MQLVSHSKRFCYLAFAIFYVEPYTFNNHRASAAVVYYCQNTPWQHYIFDEVVSLLVKLYITDAVNAKEDEKGQNFRKRSFADKDVLEQL